MYMHNILMVDDEVSNLNALERTFRYEYNIFSATNGEDALAIMEQNHIVLIIADHRMPGMTGVELMQRTVRKYPDIVRIVLTAYTDEKLLMDAINAGHVYGYVAKPWKPEDLKNIVREGIESYEADRASREPHIRVLLHSGIVSREQLGTALQRQKAGEKSIGEVLVEHSMISRSQLNMATKLQESKQEPLDEVLIEIGAISRDDLEMARALQRHERKKLTDILVELGYTDEESIYSCYALQLGLPYISLSQLSSKPELDELLPSKLAYKYTIVPMDIVGKVLVVAALEPLSDSAKSEIEKETGYKVMAVYTSQLWNM